MEAKLDDDLDEGQEEIKEASFQFSLAELGSSITSSLGGSVAASEFRALEFVELDNWEIEDLEEILDPRDIYIEKTTWSKIERQVYMGQAVDRVYLALKKEHAYFFAYDENLGKLDGFSSNKDIEVPEQGLEAYFKDNFSDWLFIVCSKKTETKLAFIPGIGGHTGFGQLFGRIGRYIFSLDWLR